MTKTTEVNAANINTVEGVRLAVKSYTGGALAFLSGVLQTAARVDFALFVAVALYMAASKDKADRKARRERVKDALAVYGKESLAFTAENIGALVLAHNLTADDIFKRTRLLKENMARLKTAKDRDEVLAMVKRIEDAAKAAAKAAKDAAPGIGDKADGDDANGGKANGGKAPGPVTKTTPEDALAVLTVIGGPAMLPVYVAFGKRPDDDGFRAADFLAYLVTMAVTGVKAHKATTTTATATKTAAKVA